MLSLPNASMLRMRGGGGGLAAATLKAAFNSPATETRVPQVIFSMLRNITIV